MGNVGLTPRLSPREMPRTGRNIGAAASLTPGDGLISEYDLRAGLGSRKKV
jgi:hypothetical protein